MKKALRLDAAKPVYGRMRSPLRVLAKASQQEAKAKQAYVIETPKQLAAAKTREAATSRRFYRAIYKKRSKADLGLNGRRPIEVRNICFDPRRQKGTWEKLSRTVSTPNAIGARGRSSGETLQNNPSSAPGS